jgi:hypothetical protein
MVGILILTDKAKERGGRDVYDAKKNYGINKILSQLDRGYEYCSTRTMDNYEHVLFSVTSYYDILNLIKSVPLEHKSMLHIGGPGVNNIRSLLPIIDTAWFGRCDLGEVNGILDGKEYTSLWRKLSDPLFDGDYEVCPATISGLGYDGEEELSVGCSQKCKFCHYSWWNKYIQKDESSYKSGYTHYEDFFQSVDWSRGRVLTALDGMTEDTRRKVGKPLSYNVLKEKILESNDIPIRSKNLTAKIYSVIGFPWEEDKEIDKCDITRVFKECERDLRQPMLFYFHLSHFVPMQKTPLWYVKFNTADYWQRARDTPVLFDNGRIRLYTGTSTTSNASAAVETIIQRSGNDTYKHLKALTTRKYLSLPARSKMALLNDHFGKYLSEQDLEMIPNVRTPYKYNRKGKR